MQQGEQLHGIVGERVKAQPPAALPALIVLLITVLLVTRLELRLEADANMLASVARTSL